MRKLCLLALALGFVGAAQTSKPNFSGHWELVLAKSDFGKIPPPKRVTNVVEHREPYIKVKSTMVVEQGEFSADMSYRTTGAEDMNDSHGAVMKTKSRWEQRVLVTEGEVEAGHTIVRFKERWRLVDEGKTWINDRVMVTPGQGEVVQKLVFAKK